MDKYDYITIRTSMLFIFCVFAFLPQVKGLPIKKTALIWGKHWFWKRMVTTSADSDVHGGHGSLSFHMQILKYKK
ncbi:hypothetical protein PanWU01x14_105220 [Parasponia andersonii]|uniref:Transmembrane protein n=1 Tax=Parasponia andersonii TaxID=3476 RepID=A0A2P5D1L5_PARAD|nr:hypothetical protein PanWU01x14_105220 [Parasponia andersonii]